MKKITSYDELKKIAKERPAAEISDDVLKRKALEMHAVSILVSPEKGHRRASPRQLDTGLNEVLLRIATRNGIRIGIDIEDLQKATPEEKAERLARIRQNLKLCRKTKTKIAIKSVQKTGQFTLLSIGASTAQVSEAQCF